MSESEIKNITPAEAAADKETLYQNGLKYYKGEGAEKDHAKAMEWFEKAAGLGHAKSQFNLAKLYYSGENVDHDLRKAKYWMEKAQENGYKRLATQFLEKVDADLKEIDDRNELQRIREEMIKAAESGDPGDQYALAKQYDERSYIDHSPKYFATDKGKARYWYGKAAENGHPEAMLKIGDLSRNEGNYAAAVSWYEKCSDLGDVTAMHRLGDLYSSDTNRNRDFGKAVDWYLKGTQKNDAGCMYALGKLYLEGKGVRQDLKAAAEWFEKCKTADSHGFYRSRCEQALLDAKNRDRVREAKRQNEEQKKAEAAAAASARKGIRLPDLTDIIPQIEGIIATLAYYGFLRLYLALGGCFGGGHATLEVKGMTWFLLFLLAAAGIFFTLYLSLSILTAFVDFPGLGGCVAFVFGLANIVMTDPVPWIMKTAAIGVPVVIGLYLLEILFFEKF